MEIFVSEVKSTPPSHDSSQIFSVLCLKPHVRIFYLVIILLLICIVSVDRFKNSFPVSMHLVIFKWLHESLQCC